MGQRRKGGRRRSGCREVLREAPRVWTLHWTRDRPRSVHYVSWTGRGMAFLGQQGATAARMERVKGLSLLQHPAALTTVGCGAKAEHRGGALREVFT